MSAVVGGLAGYLHDVGKLAIPSNILSKPGTLTDEEWAIFQQHAKKGEQLLMDVSPSFAPIARGVRTHHERWDGSGYPDGLDRESIPVFGRILAVVDVFEALTSKRPYRDAWREEDAAALIREGIGTLFDARCAQTFLELWEEDEIHVEGRHGLHPDKHPTVFDLRLLGPEVEWETHNQHLEERATSPREAR